MIEAKRKSRRRILVACVTLLALPVVVALSAWALLRSEPSYWRPPDATAPRVRQAAQDVEGFVTTQTTAVRPAADPWAIELSEDQANAWLASRLPRWLANQDADPRIAQTFPRVMVRFASDRIELAAEVSLGGKSQVFRAVFVPQAANEGQAVRLKLAALYAGRLRLPVETVIGQLASRSGEDPAVIRRALEGVELRLPLADKREVKVVGVELHKGRLVLVCVTK